MLCYCDFMWKEMRNCRVGGAETMRPNPKPKPEPKPEPKPNPNPDPKPNPNPNPNPDQAPFPAFVPTLFARSVPGKKLDTRAINTLQLTLSKFEYDGALNPAFTEGAFRLELESIEAF